jgi:hypothetical protein
VFVEWNGHNNGLGDVIGQVSIPEPLLEMATRDEIIAAITDPVRTVITPDGCKFSCSLRGEHELYHLNDDPFETQNLAGAERAPLMQALADRIRRWQERTGDTVTLPSHL